jgi:uncharacterized protein YjiS (DUF1127 family)
MGTSNCTCIHGTENLGLPNSGETVINTLAGGIARIGQFLLELEAMMDRAGERRAMRGLGEHILRDIGLSRADVEREASKPFWRG